MNFNEDCIFNQSKYLMWVTCLPPVGEFDVGVFREVWDAIRDLEASSIEGWRGQSSRLRWICLCGWCFSKEPLADCLINAEAVHGPATE